MKVTYALTKEESKNIQEEINMSATDLCAYVDCPNIENCDGCPMEKLNTKWAQKRAEMCEEIKQLEG